jgi:hypothetical protein
LKYCRLALSGIKAFCVVRRENTLYWFNESSIRLFVSYVKYYYNYNNKHLPDSNLQSPHTHIYTLTKGYKWVELSLTGCYKLERVTWG